MIADLRLDTSNYPRDHPLYSDAHKAELGFYKDEGEGSVYEEFVLLRPKLYSMKCKDRVALNKIKCKGIAKRNVKKFTHEDYLRCCFHQTVRKEVVRNLQSESHVVFTQEKTKVALTSCDDKYFWVNNIKNVPYGYHMIPRLAEYDIPNFIPPQFEYVDRRVDDEMDDIIEFVVKHPRLCNSF